MSSCRPKQYKWCSIIKRSYNYVVFSIPGCWMPMVQSSHSTGFSELWAVWGFCKNIALTSIDQLICITWFWWFEVAKEYNLCGGELTPRTCCKRFKNPFFLYSPLLSWKQPGELKAGYSWRQIPRTLQPLPFEKKGVATAWKKGNKSPGQPRHSRGFQQVPADLALTLGHSDP